MTQQDEILAELYRRWVFVGNYDPAKVSGLKPDWFYARQFDFVDFRGDLQIRSNLTCAFGRRVRIITASHDIATGHLGEHVNKYVWIDPDTFIGSFAILYNCHIQTGAVVACGAVVRNMIVPPHTLVEGNPARIVKEFKDGKWIRTQGAD
jgi:acetyltransferase-like isoleucine patch superfamily enzyme